ncbi:MAG: spondin domain-containing protein [Pseudomonadales bacterium]
MVESNLGDFELLDVPSGAIVRLEVTGDFVDEVTGMTTTVENLRAVVEANSTGSTWNVNLLTHLAAGDVATYLGMGMPIVAAQQMAKMDLTTSLNTWLEPPKGTKVLHELNLINFRDHTDVDNGYLLAATALVLEYVNQQQGITLMQALNSIDFTDSAVISDLNAAAQALGSGTALADIIGNLLLDSGLFDVSGIVPLLPPNTQIPATNTGRCGLIGSLDLAPEAAQFVKTRSGQTPAPSVCSPVTYTLAFQGTWSETTHPGAFPGERRPHFTTLVVATHSDDIHLWESGELATKGLEDVAEVGQPGIIMMEITAYRRDGHIGDGKYVGIGSGGTASTMGTVTTTRSHPLLSLASMIAPTPDWFLGVDSEPLFMNGAWRDSIVLMLLPYDAGTENGSGFSLSNADTIPTEPIARVHEGPLREARNPAPLATLTITRMTN